MSASAIVIDHPAARSTIPRRPWPGFVVLPCDDEHPRIRLEQIDRTTFRLGSTIHYQGPTGLFDLDVEAERVLRSVDPRTLPSTDLASIPAPLRWWISSYGGHTPAALIHDRFIGDPADGVEGRPRGVSEQAIDRYFRFMLREVQVPFFRRWLMWAAVACRTRLHAGILRPIGMVVWLLAALTGIGLFVAGLARWDPVLVVTALALPLVVSPLWGQQAGAGLIIAYVGIPCLLPPTALAVPFLAIYAVVESAGVACSRLFARRSRIEGPR